MQKQSFRLFRLVLTLALVLSMGPLGHAVADQSSSTNYMVNETHFGSGSSLNDCSTNYCAKTSAGDLVVGSGTGTAYSAQFGSTTTDTPLLEVIAIGGLSNMGVLDTATTGTATSSLKVRTYLSSGYTIQLTGSAPTQGLHTLTSPSTPTSSHQGAEQFGINMVANTAPAIGTNPVQIPDSSFSYGVVESDYNTPDLFKYLDGDTVAHSTSSSGETDYTISMIINVSGSTPGGRYNGVISAVVVPVF